MIQITQKALVYKYCTKHHKLWDFNLLNNEILNSFLDFMEKLAEYFKFLVHIRKCSLNIKKNSLS